MTVSVRRATGHWYALRLPYDKLKTQAFNVEMRDKVSFKVWVPNAKCWLVHQDYCALYLLEAARHGIITYEDATVGIKTVEEDKQPMDMPTLGLLRRLGIDGTEGNVPLEFVEHCYLFWARKYHGQPGAEGWLEDLRQVYLRLRERYQPRTLVPVDLDPPQLLALERIDDA